MRRRCLRDHDPTAIRRSLGRARRTRRRVGLAADRRNASDVHLLVARDGIALPSYRAHGVSRRVAVWVAINARDPSPSVPQVRFKLDYSGRSWKKRNGSCRPYDGPALAWFVTGCTAADGSYWTVQSWQRVLPDLGFTPWLSMQTAWELHVSHWTGSTAELELHTDWVYNGRGGAVRAHSAGRRVSTVD